MTKWLAEGSFIDMVAHGDDVFVIEPHPTGATLHTIATWGRVRPLAMLDDRYATDLLATSQAVVWTEQIHPMQAAWHRSVRSVDRAGGAVRVLAPHLSMRVGPHDDGHGGAVLVSGDSIARIGPDARALTHVFERPPAGTDLPAPECIGYASAVGSDGANVYWSNRSDASHLRLCALPLAGGSPVVLRDTTPRDLQFLGPLERGCLVVEDGRTLLALASDGAVRPVRGEWADRSECFRYRRLDGDLWLHGYFHGGEQESPVYVLRRGTARLERLPFTALRFDVTPDAIYLLTARGVEMRPHRAT